MVKLHRIYSETGLFDEVKFNNGLNIISGKCSIENRINDNGIGKSSLVRMIDFGFLSESGKRRYKQKKYNFLKNNSICLEFYIGNELYKIKRYFNELNKAHFGKINSNLIEYEDKELRDILGDKFFNKDNYSGAIDSAWFRTLMRFFIKDDLKSYEREDPINFSHSSASKISLMKFNLFLLDLQNESIVKYEDLNKKEEEVKKLKNSLVKELEKKHNKSFNEIKLDINQSQYKINNIEKSLKDFKFADTYIDIENELIALSNSISKKLMEYSSLDNKLQKCKKAIEVTIEIDIDHVTDIYNEIDKQIGNYVKHTLEDIINFRKNIAENRKKFVAEKINKIEEELKKISQELKELDKKRSELYSLLEEKEAISSIKNSYERLIDEKTRQQDASLLLQQYESFEQQQLKLNTEKTFQRDNINNEITCDKNKIANLQNLFLEILKNALFVDESTSGAVFDISPITKSNASPVDIKIEVPKEESLGNKRFKILTYDLIIMLNIIRNNRKMPYFLIHDGIFHAMSLKTVVNTLNYINNHALSHNFQYIITANESELSTADDSQASYGEFNFNIREKIIAEYDNIPEKMFFKREFQ